MLGRSARPRHPRTTSQLLASSFAQLQLPWLAPAQLRWSATHPTTQSPTLQSNAKRNPRRIAPTRSHARNLATATDQYVPRDTSPLPPNDLPFGFRSARDSNVPFDFSSPIKPGDGFQSSLSRFKDDPVTVPSADGPGPRIAVSTGLLGNAKQLLTHLHTSLSVGRRARAKDIVQRLTEKCGPRAPVVSYAHTVLLEDMLKSLATPETEQSHAKDLLRSMQKWFEVEVRNKSVALDAKTLIIMIQAVIHSLDGSQRDRSIRRYVDIARDMGPDELYEVLESEEYDDHEHVVLQRATADDFEEVPDIAADASKSEPAMTTEVSIDFATQREDTIDLAAVPEVLATKQKGSGLEGIKRTMNTFIDLPPLAEDAPAQDRLQRALERQRVLEQTSVEVAIDRWRIADEDLKKIGIHTAMQSKPVGALMWQWYQTLLPALEQELEEVKKILNSEKKGDADRAIYGPYLELLPLRKIAANTILYIMSKVAGGRKDMGGLFESDLKLNQLTIGLANTIEVECALESEMKQKSGLKDAKSGGRTKRAKKQSLAEAEKAVEAQPKRSSKKRTAKADREALASMKWDLTSKVKLGAMLISKLIESAQLPVTRPHPRTQEQITQLQPAFLHRIKYVGGKRVGTVVPNPEVVSKMQSEPVGSLLAKRMPMVVEPKPWTGFNKGGYLHYPNDIVRLPAGDRSGKDYFIAADDRNELDTLYQGLTALGKTAWKVNHDVFKVQLEAWNSGDAIANFAPLHPQVDLPPEPDASADAYEKRRWLTDVREIENYKSGQHSKRCFQNFQLEIARTVLNETLYFPHNLDFRGRAYPIPPYLNHMGADNVRGLLTFDQGKELGETGLRWLKIHLATVAGHDKASMDERVEFTMSHLDEIYDSVRNPLDGKRWWLESEDAWQTLAACFELTKALDSPDPAKFVSNLPVQQDGTCNGLQHYAALGGDKAGAAQVNLEPGDRPADVYTAVADAIKKEVDEDAARGDPIAQKLQGRLTRKCVKQPVMTNVYGVTFYGARQQVAKQLAVVFPEVGKHDAINIGHLSNYVATKIFKSLGTMFAGAQAIQTWLGVCADRISTCLSPEQIDQLEHQAKEVAKAGGRPKTAATEKGKKAKKGKKADEAVNADETIGADKVAETDTAEVKRPTNRAATRAAADKKAASKPLFKSTVVWTTPLRLPVIQPYRTVKTRIVTTTMQNVSLLEPQVWDPVSKRKQLQAFPPNFIHSLDATHMLLSALKCTEQGMTFASIHDSFWTHACDVNRMSNVLRDAFIAMHSEDIIGRLREEFEARYRGCMYMEHVLANSSAGQQIIKRRNEIKNDKSITVTEFALEAERLRLLNSEDAEERVKGAAMVTPGSIAAAEGVGDSALAAPSEMAGQMLGEIPGVETDADAACPTTDSSVEEENDDGTLASYRDEQADAEAAEASLADKSSSMDSAEETDEASTRSSSNAGKEKKKAAKPPVKKVYVWLPLTFPKVPAKGDFDVKRLRESRYFFH